MKFSRTPRTISLLIAVAFIAALIPAMAAARSIGGKAVQHVTFTAPDALDSPSSGQDRASATVNEQRPRRVFQTSETASAQPDQAVLDRSLVRPRRVTLRPPEASYTVDPSPNNGAQNKPPEGSTRSLHRPRATVKETSNALGQTFDWRRILDLK